MPVCPSGHSSATSDYCDQCGAKLEADPAALSAPAEATPTPTSGPASGAAGSPAAACPNCQSPMAPDDKFCEVCGYDFAAGTLPAAPIPQPATAGMPAISGPPWEAVVTADRDYYERTSPDEVTFPDDFPERVFSVAEDEVLIGRRSDSRGVHPQIDLSGTPEDSAVSRRHAVLRRQLDGTWTLMDAGSTNGTHLNDDPSALALGVAVPVKDGDRIYLGAWTRITLRAPAASGAGQ